MNNYRATCLCGDSEIEIIGQALSIANCHCQLCRRHSGGPFSSYLVIKKEQLRILRDAMSTYAIENGEKHFCGRCGTPVYNVYGRSPDLCMVYLGTVKGHEQLEPRINVWCDSMLPWVDKVSDIRSFAGDPPAGKRKD